MVRERLGLSHADTLKMTLEGRGLVSDACLARLRDNVVVSVRGPSLLGGADKPKADAKDNFVKPEAAATATTMIDTKAPAGGADTKPSNAPPPKSAGKVED